MREKHEASDIERYNIEVCVSRKEEIPICFWTFYGCGRGNYWVAWVFLDSLHVYDRQGLGDVVGMTTGGTDDGIEDLILEIGKEMEGWYLVAGVL